MLSIICFAIFFLILVYGGVHLWLWRHQNRLLFPFFGSSYHWLGGMDWARASGIGRIAYRAVLPDPTERVLLFHHGNGEDLGHGEKFFQACLKRGIPIVSYDYPGYGRSEGKSTEASVYLSAEAVLAELQAHFGIQPGQVVHYGRSIGSGPATYLAAKHPAAGLILENAFISAFAVASRVPFLIPSPFPNLQRLPSVRCPVTIIHGKRDRVVPIRHGQCLASVAGSGTTRLWIERAGHNDIIRHGEDEYWNTVRSFFSKPVKIDSDT